MLQTQTVSPELMELLEKIMKLKQFDDFLLVGGYFSGVANWT